MAFPADALLHGKRQPPPVVRLAGVRQAAARALAAAVLVSFGCARQPEGPPPVPEGAIPFDAAIGSASIRGTVRYAGDPPPRRPIDMDSDAACHGGNGAEREDMVVGAEGGLANVLVAVASGLEGRVFAPPSEPVLLEQRGCVYRPHVLGLQVGQPLVITNSDPTLHNVHAVATVNPEFNFGMSFQGQSATRWFARPERMIRLKCDVHPWMGAWVGVMEHPFFRVTGPDGAFALPGLPAGSYEVEVLHETLGVRRLPVTLGEGEQVTVEVAWP